MTKTIALLGVITVAILAVNSMSFEDQVAEETHYCQMVQDKAWPNYKNLDCRERKGK